jgi:hypothetical protein
MFSICRSHGAQYCGVIASEWSAAVSAAAMQQVAGEQRHRTCAHQDFDGVTIRRHTIVAPQVTSGYYFSRAVVGCEVIERQIALTPRRPWPFDGKTAGVVVDVEALWCFAGMHVDRERRRQEVMRRQQCVNDLQHARVFDQFCDAWRLGEQCVNPLGTKKPSKSLRPK